MFEIDENGIAKCKNPQGQLHNEEGPAWIFPNGSKIWYIHDKLHREDGPAIIYGNGGESCWIDGKKIE